MGSAPSGAGAWGQLDLAGDVYGWTLDAYAAFVSPCDDCAYSGRRSLAARAIRGGAFAYDEASLLVRARTPRHPRPATALDRRPLREDQIFLRPRGVLTAELEESDRRSSALPGRAAAPSRDGGSLDTRPASTPPEPRHTSSVTSICEPSVLVERLDARGHVHDVADDRVLLAARRADVADHRGTGVQPEPDARRRDAPSGDEAGRRDRGRSRPAATPSAQGLPSAMGAPKTAMKPSPRNLFTMPLVLGDGLDRRVEDRVEVGHDLLGAALLREGREVADVEEHHAHLAQLAPVRRLALPPAARPPRARRAARRRRGCATRSSSDSRRG